MKDDLTLKKSKHEVTLKLHQNIPDARIAPLHSGPENFKKSRQKYS